MLTNAYSSLIQRILSLHGVHRVVCVLNDWWCQRSEDGETIAPKHAEAMYKIVRLNYRTVLLLVLRELFTSS